MSHTTPIHIRPVAFAQVRHLLERHYAGGRPARLCRVLGAFMPDEPVPVGALLVAFPPLNTGWRAGAWSDAYRAGPRRAIARRINRDLRVIARVVVDPRFRGGGIGIALVRSYLARPVTRRTEAVASMGEHCPIFERAGMRRIDTRPTTRDTTLRRGLRRCGVRPDVLVDDRLLARALRRRPDIASLLAAWARASRATRAALHRPDGLPDIAAQAARAILAPPAVFVAERGDARRTAWRKKSSTTEITESTE